MACDKIVYNTLSFYTTLHHNKKYFTLQYNDTISYHNAQKYWYNILLTFYNIIYDITLYHIKQ